MQNQQVNVAWFVVVAVFYCFMRLSGVNSFTKSSWTTGQQKWHAIATLTKCWSNTSAAIYNNPSITLKSPRLDVCDRKKKQGASLVSIDLLVCQFFFPTFALRERFQDGEQTLARTLAKYFRRCMRKKVLFSTGSKVGNFMNFCWSKKNLEFLWIFKRILNDRCEKFSRIYQ